MELRKTIVVLLSLLLAVIAVVPVASAAERTAILPGQSPDTDIFAYLGVDKPAPSSGPDWQTYASSKADIDELMAGSGKQKDVSNVIGYLKGDREKVVLYKGVDGNYYALLQKDGKIVTKAVGATVLGSKEDQYLDVYAPGITLDKNNKSVHTTRYELSRISLSDTGSSEFAARSVYSTQITRTDSWIYLGINRASLYTVGTFTYDYGVQILSINDNTYTYQGLGFDRCDFSHSTRVTGITGYVDSSVIWAVYTAMPPKHSVDAWISCNIYGSTNGNSVTSDWVSTGFGCFGIP
jgi:hypothetical protein